MLTCPGPMANIYLTDQAIRQDPKRSSARTSATTSTLSTDIDGEVFSSHYCCCCCWCFVHWPLLFFFVVVGSKVCTVICKGSVMLFASLRTRHCEDGYRCGLAGRGCAMDYRRIGAAHADAHEAHSKDADQDLVCHGVGKECLSSVPSYLSPQQRLW